MPVEEMFMEPQDPAPQDNQETTPVETQPATQTTDVATPAAEKSKPAGENIEVIKTSLKYHQTEAQRVKEELRQLKAQYALAGQTAAPTLEKPPDEDVPYEDQLVAKITQSVSQQILGTMSQKEQEAQINAAAASLDKWAKENELEEIMPDIYEAMASVNAPFDTKVQMIKDIARGRAAEYAIKDVEATAEAKATRKLESKLAHTLPKDSATPPAGAPMSQEQKDWERVKERGANPLINQIFGG